MPEFLCFLIHHTVNNKIFSYKEDRRKILEKKKKEQAVLYIFKVAWLTATPKKIIVDIKAQCTEY